MKKYKGRGYSFNNITGEIVIDAKYVVPSSLFKYYALTDWSVDALTNMYVYAAHPALLNDPFDCDMDLAQIEDESMAKEVWGNLYDGVREMYDNDEHFYKFTTESFTTMMFMKWGILSLTDSCENPIMWTHYAQNNGFCVEFDVSKFSFKNKGPFPIHYVDEVVPASSKDFDLIELVLIQSNVKRDIWKYENEWRLMIQPPEGFDMKAFGKNSYIIKEHFGPVLHDRKFIYPISALKSVTLGINFFKREYERQQGISANPYEIHVCYTVTCNETKVLDFLNQIGKYTAVYMMFKIGLGYSRKPIVVNKLHELVYRITEI